MNSGVVVKGSCYNDYDYDSYGILITVIELEYFGVGNRVVLFKCHWFHIEKGIRVHPMHGLIEIKYTSILCSNEPFVLDAQATQVYNSNYPSTMKERQDWWAVFKTKARSTFNLSPIENDDENVNDLHRGVYQEDDTSFPRLIAPSEELDYPAVLVDNEFEEVNPSVLVEDDGDDGSEEENEYDDDSDEAKETEDELQHEEHEFASSDDD